MFGASCKPRSAPSSPRRTSRSGGSSCAEAVWWKCGPDRKRGVEGKRVDFGVTGVQTCALPIYVWRELQTTLRPVITKTNQQEWRLELRGGGVVEMWSRSEEGRGGEEGRFRRDWSSDVCSSDLCLARAANHAPPRHHQDEPAGVAARVARRRCGGNVVQIGRGAWRGRG